MTHMNFEREQFAPEPVTQPRPDDAGGRAAAAAGYMRPALAILLAANLVYLVAAWVPETRMHSALSTVLGQLAPLVLPWVTGGAPLAAGQWSSPALPQVGIMMSAVVLWLGATRGGAYAVAAIPAAAVSVVAAGAVAVKCVSDGVLADTATGVLLAVVVAVLAVRSAGAIISGGTPKRSFGPSMKLLIAYGVIAILPLAVGRAIFAPDVAHVRLLFGTTQTVGQQALTDESTPWLYAAGLSVGVVVWAGIRLLPPWGHRPILGSALVGVVALGLGCITVGNHARAVSDDLDTVLASSHPQLWAACSSWWERTPPYRSIHLSPADGNCSHISTFAGETQTGSSDSAFVLWSDGVTTPEGQPITSPSPGALYGDVLVVPARTPDATGANAVVGVRLTDGQPAWQVQCAGGAVLTLRFAGAATDYPASGVITLPGESRSVVVGCPEGALRLDPATGAAM